MDKEEIAKIQKYVLKVNIHCDGCKHKVKKVLRQIDGVFTIEIDLEQGKVIVFGNVDSNVLIKKLLRSGKHAELWGAPTGNDNNSSNNINSNSQNQLANQVKNMHNDISKKGGGGNNKGQQKANGKSQPMPKGVQQPSNPQQTQQQLQQQLLELQQIKGLQKQNLPLQFKDMKMMGHTNQNPKAVKFTLPEDDDCSDDDFKDNEFDDEIVDLQAPLNKIKRPPLMGNGAHNIMNGMMNRNQQQQLQNTLKNAYVKAKEKKGEGLGGKGPMPIQIPGMNNGKDGGNWGKKSGGGGGNNDNGKIEGGMLGVKNCNNGNKYGGGSSGDNIENNDDNTGKKGIMMPEVDQVMNLMGGGHHPAKGGQSIGPMGNMNMAMGVMGNIPTVQGLPTGGMNNGGGGGGSSNGGFRGYFQGAATESMSGNQFQHQQQQHIAVLMNQQRAMGIASGGFQPMMHAQPSVMNYMCPQQYPSYPCPPPPHDSPYTHFFNDENTSSCSIM